MELKELPLEKKGRGEVKGYLYKQVVKTPKAYIYEVSHPETSKKHYEVFERRVFKFELENREKYPTSKSFGVWAWTTNTMEEALKRLQKIN